MAIPREAAPATVLPKSNIAQLGYQLGQQQEAREIAQADRLQGEMDKLGDLQFWAEVDSPVMGELTKIFIDKASQVAKDPTNQNLRVSLARIGSQIESVAARSADDKKRHLLNEKYVMQMGRENVSGIDDWSQAVQMRTAQPIKVEVDDNDNIRFNGQLADNFYGNVPLVSKREEQVGWVKLADAKPIKMASIEGVVGVPSGERIREHIALYYDGLENPLRRAALRDFIIKDYDDKIGRVPSDDYVASILENEELRQGYEDVMINKASELHAAQYALRVPKRTKDEGDNKDRWGVDRDLSLTPVETDGKIVISTPRMSFVPSSTGRKDLGYYVTSYEVGSDGELYVSGYKLSKELLEKAFDSAKGGQLNIQGEELSEILNSADSEPVQREKVSGQGKEEFLSQLKKLEKNLKPIRTWNDFSEWSTSYWEDSFLPELQ